MEEDRAVVAGVAQERDQALGLAEGVGADEVGALGELRQRVEQAAISSTGSGWRKTGRPKVASVMKTSQGTGSNGAQVGSGVRL